MLHVNTYAMTQYALPPGPPWSSSTGISSGCEVEEK